MEGAKPDEANTDWGAVDPTQNNVPGYFNVAPGEKFLDAQESPRNCNWFLLTLGCRRGLTFLEQQPEVDGQRLGIRGHSMGGNLTMYVAGTDARVKVALPSVGGTGFRLDAYYHVPPQIRRVTGDRELFRRTMGYQFYAPRIKVPLLHLGASNDFHGQMDATYATGARVPKDVPQRFVFAPHFNHRFNPAQQVARILWLDQHLKGGVKLPATPKSEFGLGKTAVLYVTPSRELPVKRLEIYYSVDPDPRSRFWRSAGALNLGGHWQAGLELQPRLPMTAEIERAGTAPKARARIRIDRVINLQALHRQFARRRHVQHGGFAQTKLALRRGRQFHAAFQMLIQPQDTRHLLRGVEAMIEMRREDEPLRHVLGHARAGRVGGIHLPMEIVARPQVQQRHLDARRVKLVAHRAPEQLAIACHPPNLRWHMIIRIEPKARAAHRGQCHLHARIRARHVHREIAAHRMPPNTQPLAVHLRLLLQKRQSAPTPKRQQEPVAVPRRLLCVQKLFTRGDIKIPGHIVLRRIHRTPVRVRLVRLRALHRTSAPVHRQRRVSPPRMILHQMQIRPLSTSVHVQHTRQFLPALWHRIKRRHPSRLAFERPYEVPHVPNGHSIFFPLAHHLRPQRLLARIIPRPKLRHILRHFFERR